MEKSVEDEVFDEIHRIYLPKWKSCLRAALALPTYTPLQLAYYRSSTFAKKLEQLVPEQDLILAHFLRTGQYVEDLETLPTVVEMTDALSLNYQRVASRGGWGLKPLAYRIEAQRIYRYERRAAETFDRITFVSDVDRAFILGEGGSQTKSARTYTNGVDTDRLPYLGPGEDPIFTFIGNMRTVHNRNACRYFAEEVLPLVHRRIPEARFLIVGDTPAATARRFEQVMKVEVTGRVESIPEAVQGAMCGIGALQVGAGVQNKILEYMAMGLPVVANQMGMEGIRAESGMHFLSGETPSKLADQLFRLYEDEKLREELAGAAHAFVEKNHTWENAFEGFAEDVEEMVERSKGEIINQ
jgi:glycosyltransferase involved in cell wall biosynthesis